MSLVTRKPVFGVCDQVRHKPLCEATEARWRLEISDIETRGIIPSKQRTKALIRLLTSSQVFSWLLRHNRLSHDVAHEYDETTKWHIAGWPCVKGRPRSSAPSKFAYERSILMGQLPGIQCLPGLHVDVRSHVLRCRSDMECGCISSCSLLYHIYFLHRFCDGVDSETRKSQASFQIIRLMCGSAEHETTCNNLKTSLRFPWLGLNTIID